MIRIRSLSLRSAIAASPAACPSKELSLWAWVVTITTAGTAASQPASSASQNSMAAPLSRKMKSTSARASRKLIGTSTAPMWLTASAISIKAALFFISSATRSPRSTPLWRNMAATTPIRRHSSP